MLTLETVVDHAARIHKNWRTEMANRTAEVVAQLFA
jgi:hypothetical protein